MSRAQIIRAGSVRVRLYTSTRGPYTSHEIRWHDHTRTLRRKTLSDRAAARAEAQRIADDLAAGTPTLLHRNDWATWQVARQHLLGTGLNLAQACAIAADLQRAIKTAFPTGPRPTAADVLAAYLASLSSARSGGEGRGEEARTTPAAVSAFLVQAGKRNHSQRHKEDLKHRLTRFAAAHPGPFADLTAAVVQDWFLDLTSQPRQNRKTSRPLSDRSKNNFLMAVQTLFADAAHAAHPHGPAIRFIKPIELGPVRKQFWTPDELRRLLAAAALHDPALVPPLVLGAFAKLRTSEGLLLHQTHLRLDDEQADVPEAGKTGSRLVPLPANCCAWLRAYVRADGPLWPLSEDSLHRRFRQLAARCSLVWRSNALRKSAQTYSVALDADYARVSREAGNSPKMMRRHYVDTDQARKQVALDWFSIMPSETHGQLLKLATA